MGHAKGNLDSGKVSQVIQRLLKRPDNDVRALEAMTRESDQPYDFIKTLLRSERLLDLPANDPDAARQVRYNWVVSEFLSQQQYLRSRHGRRPERN